MGEFRLIRLGEQIRGEIANLILLKQIKDPRVSTFLSINHVDISGDLAYAKVYVSSFMNTGATEKGVKGLNSAAGFIQTKLSKKLSIRQFPKLTFIVDTSIKESFELVKKIESLTSERKEKTSSDQTDASEKDD
ncbi:MAG: 30S ribosome-binding factor RbfA [Treponemataceae bacterium]